MHRLYLIVYQVLCVLLYYRTGTDSFYPSSMSSPSKHGINKHSNNTRTATTVPVLFNRSTRTPGVQVQLFTCATCISTRSTYQQIARCINTVFVVQVLVLVPGFLRIGAWRISEQAEYLLNFSGTLAFCKT